MHASRVDFKCKHPYSSVMEIWGHGKGNISGDGVLARVDELQLQKAIRLNNLPLAGKIRL